MRQIIDASAICIAAVVWQHVASFATRRVATRVWQAVADVPPSLQRVVEFLLRVVGPYISANCTMYSTTRCRQPPTTHFSNYNTLL